MIEVIHWDCLEAMKGMKDNSIDLVLTSPPYDNLRTYEDSLERSFDIFQWIAKELSRIIKVWWIIVWIVWDATVKGSETGTSFRQALYFKDECLLNIHDTMIYRKTWCPFPEKTRYYPIFEYMFVLSKWPPNTHNLIADRKNIESGSRVARKKWNRQADGSMRENSASKLGNDRKIKDTWVRYNIRRISSSSTEKDKTKLLHPATFSKRLAQDHILSRSNHWDKVLDCFAWSWTTWVACKEIWRDCILIEKEKKYIDIINKRLDNTTISLFH